MFNSLQFRIQITETTEATDWQTENIETAAKRAGKGGDYITHNGDYVFSNTDIVLLENGSPVHTFLAADTTSIKSTPNKGVKADEVVEEIDLVEEESNLEF